MKGHHTGMFRSSVGFPGDALVRVLLSDGGVEHSGRQPDPGDPVQVGVVDLLYLFDAVHEFWK